jgi:hypothetical protein
VSLQSYLIEELVSHDIRIPIGIMFSILGGILFGVGIYPFDQDIYTKSLGININLWWGLILMAFGIGMCWLGRRGGSAIRSAKNSAEGREIERREHQTGLEREPPRRGN